MSSKARKRAFVYVVVGTCGDYEDKDWWIVCAYKNTAMAEARIKAAMEDEPRVVELNQKRWDKYMTAGVSEDDMPQPPKEPKNRYDRSRGDGRYGAVYHVERVAIL